MLTVLQTALEVGLIYGLVALALFISFSILNIADLSTDGCFTLGCAVGAMLTIAGHPILALFAAMAAGMLSGYVTAFLQTRLGVESILAGIISNTGLYTINLAVMGFSSNVSITGVDTVFSLFKGLVGGQWSRLILLALIAAVIVIVLIRFFGTSLGRSPRRRGQAHRLRRARQHRLPLYHCAGAAAEHLGRVFQARVCRHRGRRHRRAEHEGLRPAGEDQVQCPQAARPVRKGGRDRCLKFPTFPRRSTPAP